MGKGLREQPEATEEGERAGRRARPGQGTGNRHEGSQQAGTRGSPVPLAESPPLPVPGWDIPQKRA